MIQREVCLKSNLWPVGPQTGRPEWLCSWREEFKGHCIGIYTTQQVQAAEDLLLTAKKKKKVLQYYVFTYTESSLVGVNRVSTRSVQKKKTKKEKCTT